MFLTGTICTVGSALAIRHNHCPSSRHPLFRCVAHQVTIDPRFQIGRKAPFARHKCTHSRSRPMKTTGKATEQTSSIAENRKEMSEEPPRNRPARSRNVPCPQASRSHQGESKFAQGTCDEKEVLSGRGQGKRQRKVDSSIVCS